MITIKCSISDASDKGITLFKGNSVYSSSDNSKIEYQPNLNYDIKLKIPYYNNEPQTPLAEPDSKK